MVNRAQDQAERQQERKMLTVVVNQKKDIEAIQKKRMVTTWSEFTYHTKTVYQQIADAYPGIQVYACGSRVRGDYIDWIAFFDDDGISYTEVKDARMKAGMAPKTLSDYDYWIPPNVQTAVTSSDADRCRLRIPESEKIKLPMWDFSKLPKDEHPSVLQHLSDGNVVELIRLHNKYKLSEYSYCCSGTEGVVRWFTWAVEQGVIK